MSLSGRTVVVFGAGGGIGQSICTMLSDAGARVVGFDQVDADTPFPVQLCNAAELESVEEALATSAPATEADVLINVAGVFEIEDFASSHPSDWERMISANLRTAMTTSRAVLPAWLERGSGSIVNFASTAGEYGSIRPSAAYAAAKGGVIAFSKSLAREVSPRGIRVNVVSPGPVQTRMLDADSEPAHAAAVSRTLLGRLGKPDDLAAAVRFLSEESTSGWITGTVLQVNGGSLL